MDSPSFLNPDSSGSWLGDKLGHNNSTISGCNNSSTKSRATITQHYATKQPQEVTLQDLWNFLPQVFSILKLSFNWTLRTSAPIISIKRQWMWWVRWSREDHHQATSKHPPPCQNGTLFMVHTGRKTKEHRWGSHAKDRPGSHCNEHFPAKIWASGFRAEWPCCKYVGTLVSKFSSQRDLEDSQSNQKLNSQETLKATKN